MQSNESITTQFRDYWTTGQFNLILLSLGFIVFWFFYLAFWNSRLIGLILTFIIRRFTKYKIKIGSISLSVLGGKIMFRDLYIISEDYSFRSYYLIVVFNYWKRYNPDNKEESDRSLKIYAFKPEFHMFNRSQVYQDLKNVMQNVSETSRILTMENKKMIRKSVIGKHEVLETDCVDNATPNGNEDNIKYNSWEFNYQDLIPKIIFEWEMLSVCFGNHLLPTTFCLKCDKTLITYSTRNATYAIDKYQHYVEAKCINFHAGFVSTLNYKGTSLSNNKCQQDKSKQIIKLGKANFVLEIDEPGNVTLEPERIQMTHGNIEVVRTYPIYSLKIDVERDCFISYNSWADSQRDVLYRFFFPTDFQTMKVSQVPQSGTKRMHKSIDIEIISNTVTNLELDFMKKKFEWFTNTKSTVDIRIPWLIEEYGYVSTVKAVVPNSTWYFSHLCSEFLSAEELELTVDMHYPRVWNAMQVWNIAFNVKKARCYLVFDYKNFVTDLVNDWANDSYPDLCKFVPFIYDVNIEAIDTKFILYANDYNWISTSDENAYVAFESPKAHLHITMPFVDFLPDVIPYHLILEAENVKCQLSIPETSTSLYILKELHNQMRIVNSDCKPMPVNDLFTMTTNIAKGEEQKPVGKKRLVHWIDCVYSPHVSVNIIYNYHPMPRVRNLWEFIQPELRQSEVLMKHPSIVDQDDPLNLLRPEGHCTPGPSAEFLTKHKFDASFMDPDLVELDVKVSSGVACLYGSLIRQLLHIKENYFGENQTPTDFKESQLKASDKAKEISAKLYSADIVDPREFRPFGAKIKVAAHNVQGHLIKHCSNDATFCPTIFIDCIGFEMDKGHVETKLQVLISPILIMIFDSCQDRREDEQALNRGSLVVEGIQVRGHAMFTDGLVEYAWLVEASVGILRAQCTAQQLNTLVHCIQCLVFLIVDQENEILPSRDFEYCQHLWPSSECREWNARTHNNCCSSQNCPREQDVKYKLLRILLDGVKVNFIEQGACLSFAVSGPMYLINCNLHGATTKEGISAVLPQVSMRQFIRPYRINSAEPDCDQWLESGSLCLGDVVLNAGIALPAPEHQALQDQFLRYHDRATKRLWFLWNDLPQDQLIGSLSEYCGCMGGCSFFGENFLNNSYSRNEPTIRHETDPEMVVKLVRKSLLGKTKLLTFGESLFEKGKWVFETHNYEICNEVLNGWMQLRVEEEKDVIVRDFQRKRSFSSDSESSRSLEFMEDEIPILRNSNTHSDIMSNEQDMEASNIEDNTNFQMSTIRRKYSLKSLISINSSLVSDTNKDSSGSLKSINNDRTNVINTDTDKVYMRKAAEGEIEEENSSNERRAKHVDLRGQLSKNISESNLLWTAYKRHLTQYKCEKWATLVHKKYFWIRYCSSQLAEFHCIQEGFSPKLITMKKVSRTKSGRNDYVDGDSGSRRKRFKDDEKGSLDSGTRDSTAKTTVSLTLNDAINVMLTPLFLECMTRYVSILTPELGQSFTSTVINRLHFQSVQLTRDRLKPTKTNSPYCVGLPNQYDKREAAQNGGDEEPVATQAAVGSTRSSGIGSALGLGNGDQQQNSEEIGFSQWMQRKVSSVLSPYVNTSILNSPGEEIQMSEKKSPSHVVINLGDISTEIKEQETSISSTYDHTDEPGVTGEHIEPDDNISTKVTKESILEILDQEVEYDGENDGAKVGLTTVQQERISRTQLSVSLDRINVCVMQLYAIEDVVNTDTLVTGLHDLTCVSVMSVCLDTASFQIMVNTRNNNGSRDLERGTLRHNSSVQHEVTVQDDKYCRDHMSNETGGGNTYSLTDNFQKTEDMVANIGVKRIHCQLRRLTRDSQFSSNVLLTAIPFTSSRVFFAFESDPGGVLSDHVKLDELSAGWIMFECGLENLTLKGIRKRGYMDTMDDYSKKAKTAKKSESTSPTTDGKEKEDTGMPSPGGELNENELKELDDVNKLNRNALVSQLKVKTVWLNFPAPKKLPNKRRINITRDDWNLLSTATPMIKAWMDPSDRLWHVCRKLKQTTERRQLAVLACLMTEISFEKFTNKLINSDVNCYDRWRTNLARAVYREPTCQAFTVMRMYLESTQDKVHEIERNLKEDTLPQIDILQRGIFALTRHLQHVVVIFDDSHLQQRSRGSHHHYLASTAAAAAAAAAAPATGTTGIAGPAPVVGGQNNYSRNNSGYPPMNRNGLETRSHHGTYLADTIPNSFEPALPHFDFDNSNRTNLIDVNRKISGAGLNSPSKRLCDVSDPQSNGNVSPRRQSAADTHDMVKVGQAGSGDVNLMERFLQDASNVPVSTATGSISATESPISIPAPMPHGTSQPIDTVASNGLHLNNNSIPQVIRNEFAVPNDSDNDTYNPSYVTTQFNHANFLRMHYRYIEDAQRNFKPLLEIVGLHIKGIRRTTLMKKFGGFFSANGILETFKIDIMQSASNPLSQYNKQINTTSANDSSVDVLCSLPRVSEINNLRTRGVAAPGVVYRSSSTFRCQGFSTRIIMRDIIGFESVNKVMDAATVTTDVDIKPTTTQVYVNVNINDIRQHVNMPLLRLVHQFVTMVYSAHDTREDIDNRRVADWSIYSKRHKKHHSKGSSNDTVITGETTGSSSLGNRSQELHYSTLKSVGGTSSLRFMDTEQPLPQMSQSQSGTTTTDHQDELTPECWKRMYIILDFSSRVPEMKTIHANVSHLHHHNHQNQTGTGDNNNQSSFGPTSLPRKFSLPSPTQFNLPLISFQSGSSSNAAAAAATASSGSGATNTAGQNPNTGHISKMPTIKEETSMQGSSYPPSVIQPNYVSGAHVKFSTRGQPSSPGQYRNDHTNSNRGTAAMERFTFPWMRSERVPLVVLCTGKVRKMALSAVLSDLNLDGRLMNLHCSFTHTSREKGRGIFQDKSAQQSFTLHSGELTTVLFEQLDPGTELVTSTTNNAISRINVVDIRGKPSHLIFSSLKTKKLDSNSCFFALGLFEFSLPHNPVKLKDVMQRNAKRISSTVTEILRPYHNIQQFYEGAATSSSTTGINIDRFSDSNAPMSQVGGGGGGGGGSGSGNTAGVGIGTGVMDTFDQSGGVGELGYDGTDHPTGTTGVGGHMDQTDSKHPTSINVVSSKEKASQYLPKKRTQLTVTGLTKGLTISVAMYHSITAKYSLAPVYMSGKVIEDDFKVNISIKNHSLIFDAESPANLTKAVKIILPKMISQISKKTSTGGKFLINQGRITQDLITEKGSYIDVLASISTLEHTLSVELLSYILVTVNLFINEIDEVIQRISGEEGTKNLSNSFSNSSANKSISPLLDDATKSAASATVDNRLWNRAARGSTKFSFRVTMDGIKLTGTTVHHGDIKFETQQIDIELTNRVRSTTYLSGIGVHVSSTQPTGSSDITNMFSKPPTSTSTAIPLRTKSKMKMPDTKPSNVGESVLNFSGNFGDDQKETIFVFMLINTINIEFGVALNDDLYAEKPPEFKNLAFFTTTVSLRSLLTEEIHCRTSLEQNREDYLIQVMRPIAWARPLAISKMIGITRLFTQHMESCRRALVPEIESRNVDDNPSPQSHAGTRTLFTSAPKTTTILPSPDTTASNKINSSTNIGLEKIIFLQLIIDDVGISVPLNVPQDYFQTMLASSEFTNYNSETRSHLIVTLQNVRVSTCFKGDLACEGEFNNFCIRFDEAFNVGSDDWKPNSGTNNNNDSKSNAGSSSKEINKMIVFNGCVVPKGSYSLRSKMVQNDVENGTAVKTANVILDWSMRGLETHLDWYISKRLKELSAVISGMIDIESHNSNNMKQQQDSQQQGQSTGDMVDMAVGGGDGSNKGKQNNTMKLNNVFFIESPPILPINFSLRKHPKQKLSFNRSGSISGRSFSMASGVLTPTINSIFSGAKTSPCPRRNVIKKSTSVERVNSTPNQSPSGYVTPIDESDNNRVSRSSTVVSDSTCFEDAPEFASDIEEAYGDGGDDSDEEEEEEEDERFEDCLENTLVTPESVPSVQHKTNVPVSQDENKCAKQHQAQPQRTTNGNGSSGGNEGTNTIFVDLKVNIKVDSGNCVLHPRINPNSNEDNQTQHQAQQQQKSFGNYLGMSHNITMTAIETEEDRFVELRKRYWNYLAYQHVYTEISVFNIPAVDINMCYSDRPRYPTSKRKADLYAFVLLKKLPKDLEVYPSLLDFIEQAIDMGSELENKSISDEDSSSNDSDDNNDNDNSNRNNSDSENEDEDGARLNRAEKKSKSSVSSNSVPITQSLPVDVIVHVNVKPSTLRILSQPFSPIQCKLVLPFVDLVFTSKRGEEDKSPSNEEELGDNNKTVTKSEGGLSVTGILRDFNVMIFHPFGTSSRFENLSSSSASGSANNSLVLIVEKVHVNLCRMHCMTLTNFTGAGGGQVNTGSTLTQSEFLSCHHEVKVSAIADMGCARFRLDVRKLHEIFSFFSAWYRSSLARKLFFGDEQPVAGTTPHFDLDVEEPTAEANATNENIEESNINGDSWMIPGENMNQTDKTKPFQTAETSNGSHQQQTVDQQQHQESIQNKQQTATGTTISSSNKSGSMGRSSWHSSVMWAVNLEELIVETGMGSSMGHATLELGKTWSRGHFMLDNRRSRGLRWQMGLAQARLEARDGIVAGETGVRGLEADLVSLLGNNSGSRLTVSLAHCEVCLLYMQTIVLLARTSALLLELRTAEQDGVNLLGLLGWDQAHLAIGRSTAPDLGKMATKVAEYAAQVMRESSEALCRGAAISTPPWSNFSATLGTGRLGGSHHNGSNTTSSLGRQNQQQQQYWERVLQRHWPSVLLTTPSGSNNNSFRKAGGSLELRGNGLAVACFSGNLKTSLDWAVFSLNFPDVCFETRADIEPPSAQQLPHMVATTDELIVQIKQILRVTLGASNSTNTGTRRPAQPHMTFLVKVISNKDPQPKLVPNIDDWFEYAFQPADNAIRGYLRATQPNVQSHAPDPTTGGLDSHQNRRIYVAMATPMRHHVRDNPIKLGNASGELFFVLPAFNTVLETSHWQLLRPLRPSDFLDNRTTHKTVGPPDRFVQAGLVTNFDGPMILGIADVTWLPNLFRSYVQENNYGVTATDMTDTSSSSQKTSSKKSSSTGGDNKNSKPDNSATTGKNDATKNNGVQSDETDNGSTGISNQRAADDDRTSLSQVLDLRQYEIKDFHVDPKIRMLQATHISVPAFDHLLKRIGLSKARSSIPKWMQRGLLDHLDQVVARAVMKVQELSHDNTNNSDNNAVTTRKRDYST